MICTNNRARADNARTLPVIQRIKLVRLLVSAWGG